jgi:drug/metabolite transporter (DMT)-like permease
MTKERTTARIWLGAALALAGVAVISLVGQAHGSLLFALAAIAAAGVSAFGSVYARRHSQHDPLVTLPPSMLLAGIAVGALGAFTEHVDWPRALEPRGWSVCLR